MTPQPAGEWRWLGPRALQFRPAEPWKPLSRVDVKTRRCGDATRRAAADATFHRARRGRRSAARTDADRADFRRAGRRRRADAAALDRDSSRRRAFRRAADKCSALRPITTSARWSGASAPPNRPTSSSFRERIADGRVAILRLRLADEAGLDDETYELRAAHRAALRGDGGELRPRLERRQRRRRAALRIRICRVARRAATKKATPPPRPMRPRTSGSSRSLFTRRPTTLDILRAREALRITPPVDDLCRRDRSAASEASSRSSCRTAFTNSPSRRARCTTRARTRAGERLLAALRLHARRAGAAMGRGLWHRRALGPATAAAARARL